MSAVSEKNTVLDFGLENGKVYKAPVVDVGSYKRCGLLQRDLCVPSSTILPKRSKFPALQTATKETDDAKYVNCNRKSGINTSIVFPLRPLNVQENAGIEKTCFRYLTNFEMGQGVLLSFDKFESIKILYSGISLN